MHADEPDLHLLCTATRGRDYRGHCKKMPRLIAFLCIDNLPSELDLGCPAPVGRVDAGGKVQSRGGFALAERDLAVDAVNPGPADVTEFVWIDRNIIMDEIAVLIDQGSSEGLVDFAAVEVEDRDVADRGEIAEQQDRSRIDAGGPSHRGGPAHQRRRFLCNRHKRRRWRRYAACDWALAVHAIDLRT